MPHKIAVINEGYTDNIGDRAILEALLETINSMGYSTSFVPFGLNRHSLISPNVDTVNPPNILIKKGIKILLHLIPSQTFKSRILWLLNSTSQKLKNHYTVNLKNFDVVVIGGGQLIGSNSSFFCKRLKILASVLNTLNIPSVLIGVGFDEKTHWYSQRRASFLLKRSNHSLFRDLQSLRRSKRLSGISKQSCIPDLCFALENKYSYDSESNRTCDVAINLMSYADMGITSSSFMANKLDECILALAEKCISNNMTLSFFTTGTSQDCLEANRVSNLIRRALCCNISVFHPSRLDDLLRYFSSTNYVLSMRMHAGIISYISFCQVFCLDWNSKVRDCWSLIGQENRVCSVEALTQSKDATFLFHSLVGSRKPLKADLDNLRRLISNSVSESIEIALAHYGNETGG